MMVSELRTSAGKTIRLERPLRLLVDFVYEPLLGGTQCVCSCADNDKMYATATTLDGALELVADMYDRTERNDEEG